MGRLSAIAGYAGPCFNVVVGADGYVDLFFVVPVELPKDHAEGAIGIALPALKYWSDVLAFAHTALGRALRSSQTMRPKPPEPSAPATPPSPEFAFLFALGLAA